jgi:2-haloacid dehalogenase
LNTRRLRSLQFPTTPATLPAPAHTATIDVGKIRAVVFDTFGTVVDWRSGVARDAALFIARHGLSIAPEEFASAWRKRYQPSMEPIRAGRRPNTSIDVLHRENLVALLAEIAPGRTFSGDELDDLNKAWHRLDPWRDVVPGLNRLKSCYIIGPLSNGSIALLVNMAKRAGLPWDVILGADVSRAYKRHPQAYLATVAVLGIKAGDLMLVAAHNDDLAAARRCGLATGFVARRAEHGPGQTTNLEPEQEWDIIATDFVDLPGKLGC